ncbi:hypothetical protein [Pectinatus frisingensis]|uniref:hypothetical protein n=2 Tax=Pectinatus frisingensis TaxID=865 RepID=UPI003D8036B2
MGKTERHDLLEKGGLFMVPRIEKITGTSKITMNYWNGKSFVNDRDLRKNKKKKPLSFKKILHDASNQQEDMPYKVELNDRET